MNVAARSLATSRTYTVGLVVPDLLHPFFAEIAKGVARVLHPRNYSLMLVNSDEDARLEVREVEQLLARRVDGIILASAQPPTGIALFDRLRNHDVSFVLVDREFAGVNAHFVGADNKELGQVATQHLIERGCRRIAHLACLQISPGAGRHEGYLAAVASAGLKAPPSYVVDAFYGDEGGYRAMQQLLKRKPVPDGVFCYSDAVATGAIKAIFEAKLAIPDDIAVIGAGNLHYSDALRVPLTTIDLNCPAIGERAASYLLQLMEADTRVPPERVFMPLRLVRRESTGTGHVFGQQQKAR